MKPPTEIVNWLMTAVVIGLSGWTLKTAKDLSVAVARVEQDEVWIKTILVEQSRKINHLTPKNDEGDD